MEPPEPRVRDQTLRASFPPELPYLRLVALARGRQTASAAVFAVAFRCVVVVFRFIRAHKSKIAIYKGQLYCPFFKIHDLKLCARKESFG